MQLVADTGAQVDIIGEEQLIKIGFLVKDLLPTRVSLNCANHTKAGVLGVFMAIISGASVACSGRHGQHVRWVSELSSWA